MTRQLKEGQASENEYYFEEARLRHEGRDSLNTAFPYSVQGAIMSDKPVLQFSRRIESENQGRKSLIMSVRNQKDQLRSCTGRPRRGNRCPISGRTHFFSESALNPGVGVDFHNRLLYAGNELWFQILTRTLEVDAVSLDCE